MTATDLDLDECHKLCGIVWMCPCGCCPGGDDIAKARQSLGLLVAEVERLRAERDEARDDLANTERGHAPFNGAETTKMLEAMERETADEVVSAIINWLERLIGEGIERERPYLIESLRAGTWKEPGNGG